jgi:CPA2 family monovalent cation:H+ antiporter-2
VLAGVLGISSSAIVSKLLIELGRLKNRESPLILGIIVLEDVFLALYLALLAPVLGKAAGPGEAAADIAVAFAVLLALAAVARWGAGLVGRLCRPTTTSWSSSASSGSPCSSPGSRRSSGSSTPSAR